MTDAIRQWVEDQTGLTAIWLNPNAPRPDRPYASLQIINVARLGEADRGRLDDQGQVDVYLQREVTVSVQIYDDAADPRSALQRAEALRDSLDLKGVLFTLVQAGWAFRGVELLTDNPELLDSGVEPRATFDVRFGTMKTIIDDLGLVERVIYDGTVELHQYQFEAQIEDSSNG